MLDWGTRPRMAATAAIKTIKAIKPTLIQPFRVSSSSAGGTAEVQSIMVSVRSVIGCCLVPCHAPSRTVLFGTANLLRLYALVCNPSAPMLRLLNPLWPESPKSSKRLPLPRAGCKLTRVLYAAQS